ICFSQGMEVRQMSFKVGQIMTILSFLFYVFVHCSFSVNIGIDENSLWKQECFPFRQGGVQGIIQFTEAGFVMNLCGGSRFDFPNLLGVKKYTFFSFTEDVHIIRVEVK
uniref:Galectin n=1 Tax=Xiphophorus maculatus TaxID=8083 RepID=A0A3B5QGY3_XIPMA